MIYNIESAKHCINYVLEIELDDFLENPSDNHVYYHALTSLFGKEHAEKELKEAYENLNSED